MIQSGHQHSRVSLGRGHAAGGNDHLEETGSETMSSGGDDVALGLDGDDVGDAALDLRSHLCRLRNLGMEAAGPYWVGSQGDQERCGVGAPMMTGRGGLLVCVQYPVTVEDSTFHQQGLTIQTAQGFVDGRLSGKDQEPR